MDVRMGGKVNKLSTKRQILETLLFILVVLGIFAIVPVVIAGFLKYADWVVSLFGM